MWNRNVDVIILKSSKQWSFSLFAIMEYLCTSAGLCVAHLIWLNDFMWRGFFLLLLRYYFCCCCCPFFPAAQMFIVWNNLRKILFKLFIVCVCLCERTEENMYLSFLFLISFRCDSFRGIFFSITIFMIASLCLCLCCVM